MRLSNAQLAYSAVEAEVTCILRLWTVSKSTHLQVSPILIQDNVCDKSTPSWCAHGGTKQGKELVCAQVLYYAGENCFYSLYQRSL